MESIVVMSIMLSLDGSGVKESRRIVVDRCREVGCRKLRGKSQRSYSRCVNVVHQPRK